MQCSSVREKTHNTFARRYDSTDTRFCKQLSILDAPAFSTLAFWTVPHFPVSHFQRSLVWDS